VTIQAEDPEIEAVAGKFPAKTCVGVLRQVLQWLAEEPPEPLTQGSTWQDARTVLEREGDASGQANLAVALLRAAGVPARTASVVPVGEGVERPLFVQVYLPERGWETLPAAAGGADSSLGIYLLLAATHPAQEGDGPWGIPRGGQAVAGPERGAGWLLGCCQAKGTRLLFAGGEPLRPAALADLWTQALAQPLAARRPADRTAALRRAASAQDWTAFWQAIDEARSAVGENGGQETEDGR